LQLEFKPLEIYLGSGETIRKKKYAYIEKLHFYAEKHLILCSTRYKTVIICAKIKSIKQPELMDEI
jgi:hypothetical protein